MILWVIMAASAAIIATIAIAGVELFGGWEYKVLYLPSSSHDFVQLALLGCAMINLRSGSKKDIEYLTTCAALVAAFFLAALPMQMIDERPPGLAGSLGLYLDIPVNGMVAVGFMAILYVLRHYQIIEPDNRRFYLTFLLCLFLTLNFAFSVKAAILPPAAFEPMVIYYDTCFYLLLYVTAIMSNPRLIDGLSHMCSRSYVSGVGRFAAYFNLSK